MKYIKGKIAVLGNPSIGWINRMVELGMIFTHENGQILASFEEVQREI